MPKKKPLDPTNLSTNWSLQRVSKPAGKLFPGPRVGSQGDWRLQLFLDSHGALYERHRVIAYEKPVERWFAVTRFEAAFEAPPRGISKASKIERGKSNLDMPAEKRRETEMMFRYSASLQLGDVVDELEFAIAEGLFGDEGQRLIRRVMRRVVDARMLFSKLGEPAPLAKRPKSTPPVVHSTTNTIQ